MLEQKDDAARDPASPHEDPPEPIEIEQAARAWGVQTDYWDIWGKQHHAHARIWETAILQSLGVDSEFKAALAGKPSRGPGPSARAGPPAPTIFLTAEKGRTKSPVSAASKPSRLTRHSPDSPGKTDAPLTLEIAWVSCQPPTP